MKHLYYQEDEYIYFRYLRMMRLLAFILLIMLSISCNTGYYVLKLDESTYKLRPGDSIEKVRKSLISHQYIYNQNGENESLQYYCTKCGPKVRLITLRFINGKLNVIENKEADSIY